MENTVVTGTQLYYYFVCKRKLWYFSNEITMEHSSENVMIGKLIDESSYSREEKHLTIYNTISVDFLRGRNILHEVKKSKSIEEAAIWQAKYYLYYLKEYGVVMESARLDFPLIRETKDIVLEEGDKSIIIDTLSYISDIIKQKTPPRVIDSKICKKCSYFDLCYI